MSSAKHAANTTLALVSRAALANLDSHRQRTRWEVPWYSAYEYDFNLDFGVSDEYGKSHGASVFLRKNGAKPLPRRQFRVKSRPHHLKESSN